MPAFQFVLRFTFEDPNTDPADHVPALEKGGCDDAAIGVGRRGHLALDFERTAATADEAMRSALVDVRRAIPGLRWVEASPDGGPG